MIIKRYIVDNMNEAMIKIRYELGNDAVIVSQRKIKQKGLLGLFGSKKLEVTAAADDKIKKQKEVIEKRDDVQKELTEMKSMLQSLVEQKPQEKEIKRETKNKFKQFLVDNDIPEEVIDELQKIVKEKTPDKKVNSKSYEKEIQGLMEEIIKVDGGFEGRIHVLVGPTGVGKTTTIAKLASSYTLYKDKKVGLVTLDTYRIGAVEQLKTYAEILGIPFGVVISSKDIPEVMDRMKDRDIIFIDTTGRNSKNIMQVSETRKYTEELKADRIHLVISMTTKQKDIKRIIENYRQVHYNSLILTKLDETDVYGSVFTSLYYSQVPVSFISTGQNVPEDIEEAKKDSLIKLVMGAEIDGSGR